jgi:putative iron-regulated protein
LEGLNEAGGETNISIGYHAIEFLLWGQDQSSSGPGARPYTDYVVGGTADNQARRGQYLQACAELLVEQLHELTHLWESDGSFRASFTAMSSDAALTNILTGIGTLSKSELAGERIFTALDNQDQEDEHSCFSDNTHRDIATNAKGIYNVIHGTYVRTDGTTISGTSLLDLLDSDNATLSSELDALSELAITKANAIPNPFDQAIQGETTGGNGPVMQTVNALRDQGDKIAEAATALGLTISTELPQ